MKKMDGRRMRASRKRSKGGGKKPDGAKTTSSLDEFSDLPMPKVSAVRASATGKGKKGPSSSKVKRSTPEAEKPVSNIGLMERSGERKERMPKRPSVRKIIDSIGPPTLTDYDFAGYDISFDEAIPLLDNLRRQIGEKKAVGIYFHSDMDGLNGAIFLNSMIKDWYGDSISYHASALDHQEIPLIKLDPGIVYIFLDMEIDSELENVFRVDHHSAMRNTKLMSDKVFVLSPAENDYDYPSSATALCAYLVFVANGGRTSFFAYLNKGPWHEDPFTRALLLLASVCDNLWHLNLLLDIPIRRWIPDPEEERYLVLMSISASLLLGDEDRRADIVRSFDGPTFDLDAYMRTLSKQLTGARNVLGFIETVSREAQEFYNRIFFNLTDSIESTLLSWEKDKEMLGKLMETMPIEMKANREKMVELLKTKGNRKDEHWKRIEFYGKEMEKLESQIKVEERRLEKLRTARNIMSTGKGPRLCIVIPKQTSKQVKGIIASLLYYKGWKNIVIEERGNQSLWGSRGFTKDVIREQFSNISLEYAELEKYLLIEKAFKEVPEVFKKNFNISNNISFYKDYTEGMGGRGLIFGGVLDGKVPWVFSLLEETGDFESKLIELMKNKELGDAIQGLTEGKSTVSTAQALKAKFKSTGWLVIHPVPGTDGADVLLGNFSMGIMSLVGHSERFRFEMKKQALPLN